jgi:predicted phosphoadenosine phosphosulfate sulfurtransferase
MEFEEFVPEFGHHYAGGQLCACLVGIRTQESLNRWRTIASRKKTRFEGVGWTTWLGQSLYNAYPIYDWKTEDIWIANAKFQWSYNALYDRMQQAGLTIHQQRICQPYGDDQRKGLWLYQVIEPETWGRVVARVEGANTGAIYAQEKGNINGRICVAKPDHHTWQSYAMLLLGTMPSPTANHYRGKIARFLKWYSSRGFPDGIPDDGPTDSKTVPSWKRVVKCLLRNDYWCKGLSFSPTASASFKIYKRIKKLRSQNG